MIQVSENKEYVNLHSAVKMPKASTFLWNKKMMIHVNCRGYAVAQFMQPEPTKYSHAPNFEAKSDMFPEQPYYANHAGRFVYIKDEETGKIYSAPYEPVRAQTESFTFSAGKNDIRWKVVFDGIEIELCLTLPVNEALELWAVKVQNNSPRLRKLSIYPFFTVGFMSWMNQSGAFNKDLNSVVCSSVTPYRKVEDYFKNKELKDKTFLLAEKTPHSWEVNQVAFEGEGGLHNPSGVQQAELSKGDARYETPACILQYQIKLETGKAEDYRFIFGPAKDEQEISEIKSHYFGKADNNGLDGFARTKIEYAEYVALGKGCIQISTPDASFDNYVNHWLPRQVFYHGDTNRLSTDPQTRNYLQDGMGLTYINPEITKKSFVFALAQQEHNGSMPDGILLYKGAELKYINLVPHADHSVWLPICLKAYLDETNDYKLLEELVPFAGNDKSISVFDHIDMALEWLLKNRDERGLSYISQGDWCDPMNMVGYKGKGVSAWLTLATAYALKVWAGICVQINKKIEAEKYLALADELNSAINKYCWDGNWYARGITDDNVVFGIAKDKEGRIFINPQGWSLLSGCADINKQKLLIAAVKEQLETPFGVEKLGPPFTAMREDVGRVTQKHPGSAENGSVYNHACAFYIFGLYSVGEKENAWRLLRKMIPGPDTDDLIQRGQLPVFIPNYYRGAYRLFPRTAGRSSQLFNTGSVSWFYRCMIEGLFGLQGDSKGLRVEPQLPVSWNEAKVTRFFRGAEFNVEYVRERGIDKNVIQVNGTKLDKPLIENIESGKKYQVKVSIPFE
jgi:cellobionic acid phosphorylase